MKFFKTLTLAAAVMVGSAAWAGHAVNSMNVQFPAGANSAELTGTISGSNYDVYTFRAKKGQLLTINLHGSDPQITTSLLAEGNSDGDPNTSIILPKTGKYELRVLQSRNDARKGNAARQYNLELKIENSNSGQSHSHNHSRASSQNDWIYYTCGGEGTLEVQYRNLKGKFPEATVYYNGKEHTLTYDRHATRTDLDMMVLSSKNYSLSLDTKVKDVHKAEVISFNKLRRNGNKVVDETNIFANCLPQ